MFRKQRAAAVAITALVAASLALGAVQSADATGPNFKENQAANFTAILVKQGIGQAFHDDPTFVGMPTTDAGVEVLLSATPTAEQQAKLASLRANQKEALEKNRLTPPNPPEVPITFRRVLHSKKELQALIDRIGADQRQWAAAGIQLSSWGPSYPTGTVEVRLARYSAADAHRLVQAYGPMLSVSTEEMTAIGSDRIVDTAPWYGGDRIDLIGGGGICTSWFSATNATGQAISATAGHCNTGTWRQGSNTFGTTTTRVFGGNMDAQMIPVTSNAPRVWSDPTSQSRNVIGVGQYDQAGDTVCTDGAIDREVCRVRIISENQTVMYNGQQISGLVYCHQLDNRAAFSAGNSGGPVEATSGSSETLAVGMISARVINDPSYGWYLPARKIASYFRLTIKLS